MDLVTCDRTIRGEGTADGRWRAWLNEAAPPAIDASFPGASRLVVVAPQPDDEVIACGGLLMQAARRGAEILVIAVTDGEASHAGIVEAQRLAGIRREESRAGLRQLGAGHVRTLRLRLPDGDVGARVPELTALLQQEIRSGDTLVTTWRWDGHPDHEATGLAAARACESIGCALIEAPVWMWHWAEPADPRVPWHSLRALPLNGAATRIKQAALAEHRSQLTPRDETLAPVLGANILHRAAWRNEYFFC